MNIPTFVYPVLFMLHGYSENENAWVTKGHINKAADHLIAAGDVAPVLVSCPDQATIGI